MVTIVGMRMIMNPACLVVQNVRGYDENDSERQQIELLIVPDLLGDKENKPGGKNGEGDNAVMVTAVSMPEGVATDSKGQRNHEIFEGHIMHQVDAQHRQGTKNERQHCAMNGTGKCGNDARRVPIHFCHGRKDME